MVVAIKKSIDVLVPPAGLADRPDIRDNEQFLTKAKNIEISNEAKGPFLKQRQAILEMFDLSISQDNERENQFYADIVFKSSNGTSWYIVHLENAIRAYQITKTGLSGLISLVGNFKTTYGELPDGEVPTFEQREDIIYYGNSKANLLIYHSSGSNNFATMKMAINEPKTGGGLPPFNLVDNAAGNTVRKHRVKIAYAVRIISTKKIILCSANSQFKEDDFGDTGRQWKVEHTNVAADIDHEAFPAVSSLHPDLEAVIIVYITLRSDLSADQKIDFENEAHNEEDGSEFVFDTNTYYEESSQVFLEAGNDFLISKAEIDILNIGNFLETEFLLPFGEAGNLIPHILTALPNSPAFKIHKDRFTVGVGNKASHGRLTTTDYLKLLHDPEFDFTIIKATNEDINKIKSVNEDLVYGKTNSVLVNYQGNVLQDEQIVEDDFGIFGDTLQTKRGAGYVVTSLNELRTFTVQGIGGTDLFGRILLDKNQVKYEKSLSLWLNDKFYVILKVNRQNVIRILILKQHDFFKRGGEFGVFEYVIDTKLTIVSIFDFENEVWFLAHNKLFGLTENYIWGFNNLISVTNKSLKIPADKPVTDPPELTMNGFDSDSGIQGNGFIKFKGLDTQFLEDTKAAIENCFTDVNDFSVYVKLKLTDITKSFNIMWLQDDASNEVFMQYDGAALKLKFRIKIGGVTFEADPLATLVNDKIHRIAFVKAGSILKISLDDTFLGSTGTVVASTFRKFTDNFNIGGGDTSLPLTEGQISYLSVSNDTAITPSEITNTEHFKLFKFVDTDHPDVTESFEMLWQHSPVTGKRRRNQLEMRRQFAYLNNDVSVTARIDIDGDRDSFEADIVPDAGKDSGVEWKEAKYKLSAVNDHFNVLANYMQFLYKSTLGQGNNVTFRGHDLNIEEAAREQIGDDFRPSNWLTQLNDLNVAGINTAFSLFCGKTATSLGSTGIGTHEHYFWDRDIFKQFIYTSESAGAEIHQLTLDQTGVITADAATTSAINGPLAVNKEKTLLAIIDETKLNYPTTHNLEIFSINPTTGAAASLLATDISTNFQNALTKAGFGTVTGIIADAVQWLNETTLLIMGSTDHTSPFPLGADGTRLIVIFSVAKSTGVLTEIQVDAIDLPTTGTGEGGLFLDFIKYSPNKDYLFIRIHDNSIASLQGGGGIYSIECDKFIKLKAGFQPILGGSNGGFPTGIIAPTHQDLIATPGEMALENVEWSRNGKYFYALWMQQPDPIGQIHYPYILQAYKANSDKTFTLQRTTKLDIIPIFPTTPTASVKWDEHNFGKLVKIFASEHLMLIDSDVAASTQVLGFDKDRISKCGTFFGHQAKDIVWISDDNRFFTKKGTALNRFQL